jgi:hypothetical protein
LKFVIFILHRIEVVLIVCMRQLLSLDDDILLLDY